MANRFWWAIFALVVMSIVVTLESDAFYVLCDGEKSCTTYTLIPGLLESAHLRLEKFDGAITALSTIALALFTWRLWVSTNLLASAAFEETKLTRDIFVADNRPFVGFEDVTMDGYRKNTEHKDIWELTFELTLANRGKAPASEVIAIVIPVDKVPSEEAQATYTLIKRATETVRGIEKDQYAGKGIALFPGQRLARKSESSMRQQPQGGSNQFFAAMIFYRYGTSLAGVSEYLYLTCEYLRVEYKPRLPIEPIRDPVTGRRTPARHVFPEVTVERWPFSGYFT